jgi:hypothetical protein
MFIRGYSLSGELTTDPPGGLGQNHTPAKPSRRQGGGDAAAPGAYDQDVRAEFHCKA